MRIALLALLLLSSALAVGCACDHRPTSFFWDTRLVPTDGQEPIVTATGHTDHVPVMPQAQPVMPMQ
jgi:hypothetical protein